MAGYDPRTRRISLFQELSIPVALPTIPPLPFKRGARVRGPFSRWEVKVLSRAGTFVEDFGVAPICSRPGSIRVQSSVGRSVSRMRFCDKAECNSALLGLWLGHAVEPAGPYRATNCSRYWVGDCPTVCLNTRLKCVRDWNPTSNAISLTRRLGLSRRFLARSMRIRER